MENIKWMVNNALSFGVQVCHYSDIAVLTQASHRLIVGSLDMYWFHSWTWNFWNVWRMPTLEPEGHRTLELKWNLRNVLTNLPPKCNSCYTGPEQLKWDSCKGQESGGIERNIQTLQKFGVLADEVT